MNRFLLAILSYGFMVALSGCTATKYLKEGESFYAGAEIKFQPQGKVGAKKQLENTLMTLVSPQPNTEILGMRPGVWLYFRQKNDEKNKGLKAFIRRKFGQTPVLMADAKPDKVAELLTGQLQNEGYFKSEVEYEVKERKKESKVIYRVLLHPPYRLREITYPSPKDSTYAKIIRAIRKNSYLEPNQRYELARLQAEQQRIETEVEDFGIYYFDDRYLIHEADSTVGEKQVDLRLRLEQGMPERARRVYRIGEVNIYSNFTLDSDTSKLRSNKVVVDSMNYFDVANTFRPRVITRVINQRVNRTYARTNHALTLSHLMDLGVFKFVNVQYEEMYADSNLLRTDVFLTPFKQHSLRAEFQLVSKSNSFVGPGIQGTYTNRNFLGGAELLEVRVNSSYEVQISKRISGPLNSFEFGVESSLMVPRFISPIRIDYSSKKYLPKTEFRLSYNLQNRVSYFRLNSFNAAAGYQWRETEAKSHELFPIDILYVKTGKSPEFEEILERNPFLRNSFEDQFIIGSRYSYTINNQLKQDVLNEFRERRFRPHSIFFNGNIQVAGNLLNAVQELVHDEESGAFTIFNAAYSQFVRGDIDFRHYWQFDEHNKLASRLILGVGYPLGNSSAMPYIRQFSIGGSNSIRAFPARSLGPGSYNVVTATDTVSTGENGRPNVPLFIDQRADVKIEGNTEFRFDIIKAFKGALFVDAGNIWLLSNDSSRLEGKFDWDNVASELAVGTGLGLRFDLSFFVLRLDIAFPLRKPWRPRGDRWVFDEIDFGSSAWRGENLIYNLAIGYPF
jgi:outer membrane protein assembly factor BamA